ncbi:MAG: RNA polymerase sigma factor [Saprospiraceae bacterium]|nr:RNA polymerase sigma factor [Saprospiraceae bacterium]
MTEVKTPSNSGNKPSDSELIARYLQEQNPEYFNTLYRRYAGKVFAKCISMLADEALARDAVQDIFIKVYLNLSRFNEQSSFSTWLYSITYNFCIDLIRKKKKVPITFTDDAERIGDQIDVEIPDSVLLEMKHGRLEKVLAKMPEGDRIILLMKYMDDMSIKDIAEFFQKTESAIKMQIMRAKQKAQAIYDDMYASDPIEG